MTTTTKTFLILGIAGLVPGVAINSGLVDGTNASALYIVLPIGAVFLGMFLLSKVLEKETAAYDREQQAALAAADAATGGRQLATKAGTSDAARK
jgi:TRAP-type C4-dicarboxylate transport system permease small subunit